jgi:phage tail-like protein
MSASSPMISLVADFYNRYPGEQTTFYLRFTVPEQKGSVLQLAMPEVLEIESLTLPDGIPISLPRVVKLEQEFVVQIPLEAFFSHGQTYDLVARVRIHAFPFNHYLITEARLAGEDGTILAAETLQIAIHGKGKYLEYLPELYSGDDFTSRFLMLFESFWKPISQQIDQVENYFDPDLTPPGFLPWLASWVGLPMEPSLPMDRMRSMLRQAILLYQCRGTPKALKTYLEIYTDGEVEIEEHRAKNFVLGQSDTLGENIALGVQNQADFVRIIMRVPKIEITRSGYSEAMYKRKLQEIIRSLIPAHSQFEVTGVFDA